MLASVEFYETTRGVYSTVKMSTWHLELEKRFHVVDRVRVRDDVDLDKADTWVGQTIDTREEKGEWEPLGVGSVGTFFQEGDRALVTFPRPAMNHPDFPGQMVEVDVHISPLHLEDAPRLRS